MLSSRNEPIAVPSPACDTSETLSAAQIRACEQVLATAGQEGRRQLYEYEVYQLLESVGASLPPRHLFLTRSQVLAPEALAQLPGDRVVLKLVSPDVVHKSDAGAVVFAPKVHETVCRKMAELFARHERTARVAGVLVVEFVEPAYRGFGSELFVGVRATREFGPVLAAGLGGVQTEYLASRMRPGMAVAKAVAAVTSAEQFLEVFKRTAAYEVLAGQVRGQKRLVPDEQLLHCFRAFLALARHCFVERPGEAPVLSELEVNPFACRQERLVPLDGRGALGSAYAGRAARPLARIESALNAGSIAVLGVSSKTMNFGRIILRNLQRCGFDPKHLYVVKEGDNVIDGAPCFPSISALPESVDLLVITAPAAAAAAIVDEANASGKARSGIIISGGIGETEGTAELEAALNQAIARGRAQPDGGAVFIGPNCMGARSKPARYDTFFIPDEKLDPRHSAPARRVAFISQSGAFIVSRLSNLETLDPAFAVSIGNQADVTVADLLQVLGARDDLDAFGVYVEGFANLDGIDFLRAVAAAKKAGKTVVFYKAGRTETGRSAAAGHTASLAGDYDICHDAVEQAGGIVVDTFKEFEQMLELATYLHGKEVRGTRVFAMSNAGMEAVGMADSLRGDGYELSFPKPSEPLRQQLSDVLQRHKLAGLVSARNPLDVTPAANDLAYAEVMEVIRQSDEIDALIVACVPLTPQIRGLETELDQDPSLVRLAPALFEKSRKPVVLVLDSGRLFDPLANRIRAAGVPVFRSADVAVKALGKYLASRG